MRSGYYSPSKGYWEVLGEVTDNVMKFFPDDTIEVPLRPATYYLWNGDEWVENPNTKYHYFSDVARAERNNRLENEVDPLVTNTLRWMDLTEDQKASVAAYRRALLDLTEQPGYPYEIEWPVLTL